MLIRRAAPADAQAVAGIYAYYVRHTAITFATEAPTAADYAARIADDRYPFLTAEEEGCITGFIYASAFRTKEAYRWDVELTIYLAPGHEGKGTGSALMTACLRILTAQGFLNAYSCITLPNERSTGLHRRLGFEELGVFCNTGYKLGKWHDVIWMGKVLGDFNHSPAETLPVSSLPAAVLPETHHDDGGDICAS